MSANSFGIISRRCRNTRPYGALKNLQSTIFPNVSPFYLSRFVHQMSRFSTDGPSSVVQAARLFAQTLRDGSTFEAGR